MQRVVPWKMHAWVAASLLLGAGACPNWGAANSGNEPSACLPRQVVSFNTGWRFRYGDPEGMADQLAYARLKPWMLASAAAFSTSAPAEPPADEPVEGLAYAEVDFDDADWRQLDLPHDWGIESAFDPALPGETAKLPYHGIGWYRKRFTLPAEDAGRQIYLDVDGAMSYANVWVNGRYAGGWPYGYSSWRVELTPHLRAGEENVVAVRLDNPPDSSRWYPGGGIYRNVRLVNTAPVHVAQWGTHVRWHDIGPDAAVAAIDVTVENHTESPADLTVSAEIFPLAAADPSSDRPVAASRPVPLQVAADQKTTASLDVRLADPRRWSPDEPNCYVVAVRVMQGDAVVDRHRTTVGVRTAEFTPDKGLLLNGQPTEIRGVCLHHDLGALGAAFNRRARQRQLERLKELGCNAIRTSHNPLEPELLELCDRMGLLVMDEAFDAWQMAKRDNDYHRLFDDWHEHDLRAMIRRDRNHPCVILWSLGNEVYEQHDGKHAVLARQLADIAHDEDPSRPVNMALHVVDASTNGFQEAVDVFGYNYTPFGYAEFRENNPAIPLVGSETSSCTSSRGEYFFPVEMDDKRTGRVNYQVTSYDYSAPKWAMAPDIEFKGQDENPFVAGEFVWTGFDYLGEPTPYDKNSDEMLEFTDAALQRQAEAELEQHGEIEVPSRSSYFGIFDLAGFRKDRFYLYQARWRPNRPMAHILPHWNWPHRRGKATPVHVYTSGDEAELFLNGRSLGRRRRAEFEYRLKWDDVVYQPGELKVVAYCDGRQWATDSVQTTGPPARLDLAADRATIRADGDDLSFLTLSVLDSQGRTVPNSQCAVRFEIEGPGQIVATDNGDPTCQVPFQRAQRDAFHGLCLAIVRGRANQPGAITVRAHADRLKGAAVQLVSTQAE